MILKPFSEAILCAGVRVCHSCKSETNWMYRGQKTLGTCLDHFQSDPVPFHEAVATLLRVFRGAVVAPSPGDAPTAPGSEARWVWTGVRLWNVSTRTARHFHAWALPPEAGPCAGCSYLIKAYGPEGRALCADCERTRT
jgi:hypothetical protein